MKAITTIKALSSRSNYGSLPRPPAENRIRLYGLYKQATEGNVEGIMSRPTGFSMEDEGAKKKWDAWKREEGLTKTEAKRRYISYLIDTMRIYASGTLEARELLSELEYLWDQIKDLQFSDHEDEENDVYRRHQEANPYPLPSRSPLFLQAGQSDRFSTTTPLPLASNYSGSVVPNQQYRNNLHKIYSHSRRSTMLSINDYVNQQRQQTQQDQPIKENDASVYSLPAPTGPKSNINAQSIHSLPPNANAVHESTLEDFKNWQGEINLIINKLSKEFLKTKTPSPSKPRRNNNPFNKLTPYNNLTSDSEDSESDFDPSIRLKRKIIKIVKILGVNAIKFLKNFLVTLLAILFIVWCFKKNVVVERTLVKQQLTNNKQKKELVINMILNTDENKWFIRLLSFVNSFVGFV